MDQIYYWKDDRILIDTEHPFWSNQTNIINLDGDFVNDCLWKPNLEIKNLNQISAVKPTSKSSNGSPFKFILTRLGTVQVQSRNFRIRVSCGMEFQDFPFDQQV